MWVHISRIAKEHHLPEEALGTFAMRNPTRYGVIVDTKGPKIESVRADKLVEEFRTLAAANGFLADRK